MTHKSVSKYNSQRRTHGYYTNLGPKLSVKKEIGLWYSKKEKFTRFLCRFVLLFEMRLTTMTIYIVRDKIFLWFASLEFYGDEVSAYSIHNQTSCSSVLILRDLKLLIDIFTFFPTKKNYSTLSEL